MTENLNAFLEEAAKDEALAEALGKAETAQDVIALASEKGFALTEEDLKLELPTGEVSDDELEDVAGGMLVPHIGGMLMPLIGYRGLRASSLVYSSADGSKPKANNLLFRTNGGRPKASTLLFNSNSSVQASSLVYRTGDDDDDDTPTLVRL